MDLSPDAVKTWLAKSGKNRQWLADQCSVSKKTVDGWLSTNRSIPGSSRKIIEGLMGGIPIEPKLTLPEFEVAQRIAAEKGFSSVTGWFESILKEAIKNTN